MKLTVNIRAGKRKSDAKEIRRKGNIPAIFYAVGRPCEMLEVDGSEFRAALRHIKPGRLSTTKFQFNLGAKELRAIVKDIQYDPVSYEIIHLDFEELVDNAPVKVKIPILCTGMAECSGIKLGGFLRQVIRSIKVECLPDLIPAEFFIDVSGLSIRQSKRLRDLEIPAGVKPLAPMDEVLVVIAKR